MAVGREIRLFEHGFVRLDGAMAGDLSVANSARVSFGKRKDVLDESDEGLIRFLMRDRHGSPFEHNAFRFHVRCPLFVAREWFRHRVGCLTGDAVVTVVDAAGSATEPPWTMARLWQAWSQESEPAASRLRVRRLRLRVLDEQTGEFGAGRIADVIDSGLQPVYDVRLADGKQLTMTASHRVLTTSGWRTLADAVGLHGEDARTGMARECELLVNGLATYRDGESAVVRTRRDVVLTARSAAVASVEDAGLQPTYDLCVEGPWHNFVANGIVVHNSFNEESARYHQLEGDFYVPAPEDVRSQVGKPGAYTFERVPAEVADGVRVDLSEHYERAYRLYRELIDRGLAKELARCVLPMGTFTQFYWTVNARSLMNFVSLRAADTAQLEIRRYAEAVEELFAELMPVTHAAFVANDRTAP